MTAFASVARNVQLSLTGRSSSRLQSGVVAVPRTGSGLANAAVYTQYVPVWGRSPRPCSSCQAYYNRARELDEVDTKEFKIRKMAEILGVSQEQVAKMVKMRPGLLVVPSMEFYRSKMMKVSMTYQVPHPQAGQIIVNNPGLLFDS